MNEEQYFLEAINASEPNADLIYADWLEEQGKPEADEIKDPVVIALRDWSRSRHCSLCRNRSRSRCRPHFWFRLYSRSHSHSYFCYQSCSRSGWIRKQQ